MGVYKYTQLKTVVAQLARENPSIIPPELYNKIQASWQRAYPTTAFPSANTTAAAVSSSMQEFNFSFGTTRVKVVNGDLFRLPVQCIVNAANEGCLGGGGIDGIFHRNAPGLRALCQQLPVIERNIRCRTGDAVIVGPAELASRGFTHIILAVGPVYNVANADECRQKLEGAYYNSLLRAKENNVRSIGFPAISTGIFRYPLNGAMEAAYSAIRRFTSEHPGSIDEIQLAFVDRSAHQAAVRHSRRYLQV